MPGPSVQFLVQLFVLIQQFCINISSTTTHCEVSKTSRRATPLKPITMFHRPTSHSAAIGPGCAGPPLAVPTSAVLDHVPTHVALEPVHGGQAFAVDPQLCSNADPTQRTQYVDCFRD